MSLVCSLSDGLIVAPELTTASDVVLGTTWVLLKASNAMGGKKNSAKPTTIVVLLRPFTLG
jgi:hypothetical protein